MKIKIVVEDGMITDVFSTDDCAVEIIDLDCCENFDEREKFEEQISEIRKSSEFKIVG